MPFKIIRNDAQDCCVAVQNLMLEAADLGIDSIYIARGEKIFEMPEGQALMKNGD